MKITFLGTGTSQGIPIVGCPCEVCHSEDRRDQRLRTAAFVEIGDTNILIDAGPDLRQQLLSQRITKIDALLVTHEHKDHIGGIDDLRPINFLMHEPMNIYGMKRTLDIIHKDYDYAFKEFKYPGVPNLCLNPVKEEPFHIHGIEVIPIKVKHMHLPILGYRIGKMGYITDASFIADKEIEKLYGVEILVINALRWAEHYSHFNVEQALAVIKKVKPKQAYFTHIGHSMGKHEEVAPKLPMGVALAYDGLMI